MQCWTYLNFSDVHSGSNLTIHCPFYFCDLLHHLQFICFPYVALYPLLVLHWQGFALPFLFLLATHCFASLVCHGVHPGSPHSVLPFQSCQKSGTSLTSPLLQMDSPFLQFCILASETALTTRHGHRDKCFMLFVTCPLCSSNERMTICTITIFCLLVPSLAFFSSSTVFFPHSFSSLFLKFLFFCLLAFSLTVLWELKSFTSLP